MIKRSVFLWLGLVLTSWVFAVSQEVPATDPSPSEGSPAEEPSAAAPAEATFEQPDEFFFDTVDVNVVNVEVFVTEKKGGKPITGLTRDDFRVLEDKREVAITNFYVMEGGKPLTVDPAAQVALEGLPPQIRADLPLIPEEQRLNLIVYIDNFNIRPFDRNRVFRRLRTFLNDKVRKEDRVMLVSYDRSLKIRRPFTADSNLISTALFELEKVTGHAVHRDSERFRILRDINEAENLSEVEYQVRQYSESEFNDLSFSIDALKEIVESLGGLSGRKAVLYVSNGLAMSPGADLYYALLQKFNQSSVLLDSNNYSATRKFSQLVQKANSNRVTFYTIDAAGLRVNSSSLAERSGPSISGFDTLVDTMYRDNMQSTIQMVAEDTGGFAIINTNDALEGLNRIGSDFNTYYSLGYNSTATGDGRYHRIKVELKEKNKKWVIRHRDGYRGKSMYNRMADGTTSTLMYGFERNPLSVGIQIGRTSPSEGGHYLVPVVIEVPLGKIVLVPRSGVHQGRVRLYLSALDEEGRMADVQEVPLDIQIPSAEVEYAKGESYKYRVDLQMRKGNQRFAVGVRDELGAVESFVSKSVFVGAG